MNLTELKNFRKNNQNNDSKYNTHTEPLFKDLKILQIKDILKLQQLKFYF